MRPPPNSALRRGAPNIRRVHASFTAIYAILAGFFLVAPIIFINYELIFQSGLLGFFILTAGWMLAATIWGKELCFCHGEFYILERFLISIIACSVFGFVFTFYYLYNVANILSMCDQFDTTTHISSTVVHVATILTNAEKDDQFQIDRAAKICRNEQGFGIFLLVILILVEILFLLTIAVYAWLKSWTNCLCLPRTPHTSTCSLSNVEYLLTTLPQQQQQQPQRFVYNLK